MLRLSPALLALACLESAAQPDAVARLDAVLQDIETLAADVTQLIVESGGGVLEESEIRMYLKKPDGFYWETLEPFAELVVTNGVKLWNYQPDLEQVTVEDWDSGRSELAARLLSGRTDELAQDYQVEASGGDEEQLSFVLTPLASDSVYRRISISFARGELDLIHVDGKDGGQTAWQFHNIERNQPLADELFEFEPPPGIELIENSWSQAGAGGQAQTAPGVQPAGNRPWGGPRLQ